jgi:putative superfamily III holin-X
MRFRGRTESTGELASGIVEDAQRLVRLEIELAKTELKEMALRNAVAAGMLLVAVTLVMITFLIALPVILLVLLPWHWEVALGWGAIYLLGAVVLGLVGVKMLKVKPERTLESMQETKEWFSDLTSSLGR